MNTSSFVSGFTGRAALLLTVLALGATARAESNRVERAAQQSVRASGEVVRAVGDSVAASASVASGIVAVPVWSGGQVVRGSGEVLNAVGGVAVDGGKAAVSGANTFWNFATGPVAERPPLAKDKALPPARNAVAAKPVSDPRPALAMAGAVR